MRIVGLIALALLGGCASTPPAATTPPVAAAAARTATPPERVVMVADDAAEDTEFVPPPGYTEQIKNGKRYYCSKVSVLGTRFPKDDCRTEAALRDMENQKSSMRATMEQRRSVCATGTAGCVNP